MVTPKGPFLDATNANKRTSCNTPSACPSNIGQNGSELNAPLSAVLLCDAASQRSEDRATSKRSRSLLIPGAANYLGGIYSALQHGKVKASPLPLI